MWLHGQSLDQLVPTLFGSVNNKARKRIVYEALTKMKWVQDIWGAIIIPVLIEFLKFWDLLLDLTLQPKADDAQYNNSLVQDCTLLNLHMRDFLLGVLQFGTWERIWKS
jgi:hypothetical protein